MDIAAGSVLKQKLEVEIFLRSAVLAARNFDGNGIGRHRIRKAESSEAFLVGKGADGPPGFRSGFGTGEF